MKGKYMLAALTLLTALGTGYAEDKAKEKEGDAAAQESQFVKLQASREPDRRNAMDPQILKANSKPNRSASKGKPAVELRQQNLNQKSKGNRVKLNRVHPESNQGGTVVKEGANSNGNQGKGFKLVQRHKKQGGHQ